MLHSSETQDWTPAVAPPQWSLHDLLDMAPKTNTKHPYHHYYRNLELRILLKSSTVSGSNGVDTYIMPRPVSNLSENFRFSALECKESLKKSGLNVWRLMSVIVAWLALTCKTEMHAKPLFNIFWCCPPHRIGHGQHPHLKLDMDGWMDGW